MITFQLGDIGQGARELPDRRSIFAPPPRMPSIVVPAPATERTDATPIDPEPLLAREYVCTTCHERFQAGARGRVPTECPEHRPHHGRRPRTGVRRHLPVSRKARSLAQALLSCVESGALVWKTKLGDYLVMRDGQEYHGDTLAVAIARSHVQAAPERDAE